MFTVIEKKNQTLQTSIVLNAFIIIKFSKNSCAWKNI